MTEHETVYLTTAELARRWKTSQATLRNWRFKGGGPPYFKPSGERGAALYRLRDIEAWEQKRTVGGEV